MEWTLVRRWAHEGKLPAFRRMIEEGARAELASTAAQLPDTVWPAIYSGENPAKFAKYFYVQYDPASGGLKMLDDDATGVTPFWDRLNAAGKRVCVFDAPKFPVSGGTQGFHVANWGSHASKTRRASTPHGLLRELDQRFGPHPVGDCDRADDNPKSLQALRRRLLEGVQLRGEVCRFLMKREGWDVFFTCFSESHCAGHHFWRFHDAAHPGHDPADGNGLNDTLEKVYQAIDREIGEIVETAGPATRCLVFSGHGMGPIYHASWNLDEILDRLAFGDTGAQVPNHAGRSSGARVNPWRLLKMALPGRFQYMIKSMLPKPLQAELIFRWYAGRRRWQGRRAISVPNNESVGAIRFLVKGRDRYGLVEPGTEYREACEAVAAALRELTDSCSGRKIVRQVTLTHQEFTGPFLEKLPDVTVLWDQSFAWHEIASPAIGRLTLRKQDSRSGSHSPLGFLLARGYGERPGVELPRSTVYDISPTVLSSAGVETPGSFDGRPLPFFHTIASA